MKLAIIPARIGSKRIPKKNIKDFFGKPIISYSIQAAIESGLFDTVMVSTDSIEVAEIAHKAGASVPFIRTIENSNDSATLYQVVIEVLNGFKMLGIEFKEVCCILATAPFVTAEHLINSHKLLINSVKCILPNYQDAGQFYWAKVKGLYTRNTIISENSFYYPMDAIDINTIEDFENAKIKYNTQIKNMYDNEH